jgi:hypothetical protein
VTSASKFSKEEALAIANSLGVDWTKAKFGIDQFQMGLEVELEHGARDPATNVTDDDPLVTGKIALAHLKELPDYYTRLSQMESEAEATTAAR